jgi:uncharacterized membrane protein
MGYIVLILGVALWSGAHLFKRVAPERRAAMGDAAKGGVALALVLSIVLMWWGYGTVNGGPAVVSPPRRGINNLLVLIAFYLFAASGARTWLGQKMRHPQLTGVKTWALAHLLVNGDLPSFILFGGLLAWAVVEVILINRQTNGPDPRPSRPASARKRAR